MYQICTIVASDLYPTPCIRLVYKKQFPGSTVLYVITRLPPIRERGRAAQCAAAAEEQDQRNQDCTAVGVGCDGAPADSVTADCGEPFGEAVAAASVLDSTSACAVAEAQPKLDAPPVPAFTCTRQLPAAQEFGACCTSCTYRQRTYRHRCAGATRPDRRGVTSCAGALPSAPRRGGAPCHVHFSCPAERAGGSLFG